MWRPINCVYKLKKDSHSQFVLLFSALFYTFFRQFILLLFFFCFFLFSALSSFILSASSHIEPTLVSLCVGQCRVCWSVPMSTHGMHGSMKTDSSNRSISVSLLLLSIAMNTWDQCLCVWERSFFAAKNNARANWQYEFDAFTEKERERNAIEWMWLVNCTCVVVVIVIQTSSTVWQI